MIDERDQLALFRTPPVPPVENVDPEGRPPAPATDRPDRSTIDALVRTLGIADDDPLPHDQVGELHQRWLESCGSRKTLGAFYTPPHIVTGLVNLSLGPVLRERIPLGVEAVRNIRVIDPACGSGNFLIAVARQIEQALVDLGLDGQTARHHAYGRCVVGMDIDDDAIEICRLLLLREARGSVASEDVQARVVRADALTVPLHSGTPVLATDDEPVTDWPSFLQFLDSPTGFDLVIGNPPFLSQLSSDTARSRGYAAELARRFGSAASGFVDPAALFLLLGSEITDPETGVLTLIQPISTMSTRDATEVRQSILARGAMSTVWIAEERVFDAEVDVYAPLIALGSDQDHTRIVSGPEFLDAGAEPGPRADDLTWSPLLATSRGIPHREFATTGRIGDIAHATADFRDQYYGIAPHVLDLADAADDLQPPLITTGLIDPAHNRWGERTVRFNKSSFSHPRVDLDGLPEKLADWAQSRLVPKVLLATQTRVLEPVVDLDGGFIPSVPVVTITSSEENLWKLAALLVSPPITLIALRRHLGAALSADALKLGARDVLALPLPDDHDSWEQAGLTFRTASEATSGSARRAHLIDCGRLMCRAFRSTDPDGLVDWWRHRLPKVHDAS